MGGDECAPLLPVPVDCGVIDALAGEVVDDQERREAGQLVEPRAERLDVVEHAARDHRVERAGVVELLERDAAVAQPGT